MSIVILYNFTGFGLCVKCSKYQQLKLAKYCEDILDEYLLKRPLDSMPVTNASFVISVISRSI